VLARALTLAEPEGYVRIFVDEGAPMAALLRAAAQRGIAPSYVAGLLAAFPQAGKQPARQGEPDALSLVEALSARELEILRLIAAGHSNQAIADTLVIAVSTVKRHINNIYGKLAVQSRTQALVRARELHLL
jgi:LuxR family maltose regulon positive regulatory protein